MYIPLNSGEAGQGQRFAHAHRDIQELRDVWADAIHKKDWALAAMYQLDLEKRRDQMILYAIERSESRLITFIAIFGLVVAFALAWGLRFTKG